MQPRETEAGVVPRTPKRRADPWAMKRNVGAMATSRSNAHSSNTLHGDAAKHL